VTIGALAPTKETLASLTWREPARPEALLDLLVLVVKVGGQELRHGTGLERVEREDRERGHNLMQTLQTYYECGLRVDKTAERMFLHRNSVRYRLDRVRSLLRCDIDDPQTISACVLALSICRGAAPGKVGQEHAV